MGAASGPDIVEDGLVLCLDAGSRASYSVTNILSYWTEYAGRAVHYEVLDAYSVKLKNTFNSWVGYYPATITSTGRYTITFTYYSDTNGSSLYLDNDGVMDNIYNNYTLTANIASQTYTASVDINTTGAINFYFMRFSGGNIFITDVNFYKSDTIWTDLAGSNNGTLTNGPTFSSANGGSIVFDGVNDYVSITNNSTLRPTNELTIEYIIKGITPNGWCPIIGYGNGNYTNGNYLCWVEVGGGLKALCRINNGGVIEYRQTPGIAISSTALKYMSFTMKIGDSIKSYYNGVNTNTPTSLPAGGSFYYGGTSSPYQIGGAGAVWLNGSVSFLRLYNRALTPAEIQQNYNALKGRFGL